MLFQPRQILVQVQYCSSSSSSNNNNNNTVTAHGGVTINVLTISKTISVADTVCSRQPLMTQVQHFVSWIKKRERWDVHTMWAYDLDLWPWRSPRLSVIRILVLCQSTKCKFRSMAHTGHVTLLPWPLTLEVMALAANAGLCSPSAHQLWSS